MADVLKMTEMDWSALEHDFRTFLLLPNAAERFVSILRSECCCLLG